MALQLQSFRQQATARWTWPLHVGLLPENAPYTESLKSKHWIETFCRFEAVQSAPVNILLIDTTLGIPVPEIQSLPLESDVVILIMQDAMPAKGKDKEEQFDMLKQVAERHASSGVFVLSIAGSVDDWFNELLIELSHNQALPDVLDRYSVHGYGIVDENFRSASTLSAVLDALLLNLSHAPGDWKIRINSRICQKTRYTLDELRRELEAGKQQFQYRHESGEAEGLKELMDSLDAASRDLDKGPSAGAIISSSPATSPPPFTETAAPKPTESTRPGLLDHLADLVRKMKPNTGSARGVPKKAAPGFPPLSPLIDQHESMKETAKMDTPRDTAHTRQRAKPNPVEKPRFLQASIKVENNVQEYLKPETDYTLMVRIGYFDKKWESGGQAFPSEEVFTSPEQAKEKIQIHFTYTGSNEKQEGELVLERSGNTNVWPFSFKTGKKEGEFKGEILAYHKNRLIQKVVITAYCVAREADQKAFPPAQLDVVFSFMTDLNHLEGRSEFGSSILVDSSKPKEEAIQGIASGKSLDLYFSPALDQLMTGIRDLIQDAVVNIDNHPEDLFDEQNRILLLRLALKGNSLYVNHLKKNDLQGAMQIVSHRSEFVPLDFVYTFAAPDKNATICPNAVKALKEGKCCNGDGVQSSPARHICPFGFWGFSHVIERHTSERYKKQTAGDYTVIAGPEAGRETLDVFRNTLFAGSVKVAAAEPGLLKKVNDSISKHSVSSEQARTWDEWERMVKKKKPDSLVLLVHIERDEITDQDQIEIGDNQFLVQNLMDESKLKPANTARPPFVVLIGCEASSVENHGFDISSQLMNHGAAIVVSNFTKIRGRHAGPMVISMLELLEAHKGKQVTLGEIVLKLRQLLLAKGIMVGLALITHGDADWKLNV